SSVFALHKVLWRYKQGICNEMARAISEKELNDVEGAVWAQPSGASMGDLVGTGADAAIRRSMQRRLDKLVEAGRVRVTGTGKGTRYWAASGQAEAAPSKEQTTLLNKEEAPLKAHDLVVRLSRAALEQQKLVSRPLAKRTPVGYQRDLLSQYRPNETYYL